MDTHKKGRFTKPGLRKFEYLYNAGGGKYGFMNLMRVREEKTNWEVLV